MKEKIYNIFTIFEDKTLVSTAFVMHEMEGSDEAKIEFLKRNIEIDKQNVSSRAISDSFLLKDGKGGNKKGNIFRNF